MKKWILLVDDELGLAELLAEILRQRGYEAQVSGNGREALGALEAHRFDLVVTDLIMPVMGGGELLSHMRGDAALAEIPVIMMTSMPERLPDSGYQAALAKPVSPDRLLDEVTRSIERGLPS